MSFLQEYWRAGIEIFIIWIAIYQIYRLFRATQGARIIVGLAVVLIAITLLSQLLQLTVIEWIITKAAVVLAFALLVIFQPELRSGLARLGSSRFFTFSSGETQELLDNLADAAIQLSKKRFGALFAIERHVNLEDHAETGVLIDGVLSTELALTIFHPKTSLHDGGLIIRNERVAAAACIFPVSQKEMNDRSLGLRHRAAFGLSEETDAVTVVVSEETGNISICVDGSLKRDLEPDELRTRLKQIFIENHDESEAVDREQLDGKAGGAGSGDRDLVSD
ncbi:MAG: diadenylate cyclase CdaA [Verrucomicrobiales bacterium]